MRIHLNRQLDGLLVPVAEDVKIQVEFNPARAASYRLLGYENRLLAKSDFRDDQRDAGEVGAGHRVTAFFEVVPASGDPHPSDSRLRYQSERQLRRTSHGEELLAVQVRYKPPGANTSQLLTRPFIDRGTPFDEAPSDFRFAAAVAAFGMLLRESPHAGQATLKEVRRIAASASEDDPHGDRTEFLQLVLKAERILACRPGRHPLGHGDQEEEEQKR